MKGYKLGILLMVFTFATMAALIVTPALPQIGLEFQVSERMAQWTMAIFLVGYALGQLPYGPLANRFGRKQAFRCGVFLTLIGLLISLFASSFWLFCLGRFVQALGSGAGLKVGFTMMGDLHAGHAATRAISFLTLGFGLIPGLAATIGGYLALNWGWQGPLLFLFGYSVLLLLLLPLLPETAKELHPDALELQKIGRRLYRQLKDPFILFHALLMGFATGIIYIFATISPYIGIQELGLTSFTFGLASWIPSLGLMTGVLISRSMSHRSNPRINMLSGILLILIGAIAASLCFAANWITVASLFIPAYFIYLGSNLLWTHSSAKGLSEATDKSNAAAVMQFVNLSFTTLAVFLVEVTPPTERMLLPAAYGIIIVCMFIVWLRLKPHHAKS
jgi:MFS family permease